MSLPRRADGAAGEASLRARVPAAAGTEAKSFGRNFGVSALALLVTQVLTFLVSVVLARRLDVASYGIFVFGFAFPSWFLLLISLGLDEVLATEVAADRSKARPYLTLTALLRLLMAVVALVALWAALQVVLADPFARMVTFVLGASSVVSTYAATFGSMFRAFERLEYGAVVTIIERSLTTAAVMGLLLSGHGLYEVSLAFLGGSFVALLLSAAVARKKFVWFTREIDPGALRAMLRKAVPFALFNVVGTFSYSAGIVLLTVLQGPEPTGLFNAGFTLLLALFSFLSVVNLAALPMMSRIHQESRERLWDVLHRIQRLSFIVGVPLALGGWFYAEEIITLFYGNPFRASADSFRILVLSFGVDTAIMGIGPALVATGHMKEKLYVGALGAAVMVALSFLLIPPLGPVGVAIGFLASQAVLAVLGGLIVRRYVAPLRATDAMLRSVLAGAVMLLVLVAIPGLPLWAGGLLGGCVYLGSLWGVRGMTKEDRLVVWDAIRGALFR